MVGNLPAMQGTQVRCLVWEDSVCPGATKSVRGNYWVHVPQVLRTVCLRAGAPQGEQPSQ